MHASRELMSHQEYIVFYLVTYLFSSVFMQYMWPS